MAESDIDDEFVICN